MARKPITDMSAWPSLTLEGNLIAPAMVAAISAPKDNEETRQSYRIRKGLSIRDEISTSFRVGQSHFDAFAKIENPSVAATRSFIKDFLTETLGFDDIASHEGPVSLLAGCRVPIVVTPPDEEKLDRKSPTLSTDRSRSAAFALQDFLNDSDGCLWGLATNGTVLRLMRDNASLTRPAFIEADLAQIFTNEDAASFSALWLLFHRTRFGQSGILATDCPLERWRDTGSREGEAARDRLAKQVKEALSILGSGFLEANPDLAARLRSGDFNLTEWFNELLRLVYRLIFLMVAEDRNLLHPPKAPVAARRLYTEGYSLTSLRGQCTRGVTWDRHHDRYEGIKIVFRALATGQDALALPALGGLFADHQLPHLEAVTLRNRAFMEALYRLSWLSDSSGMVPVNWRAMETEELGSVYESLLELQPQLGPDGTTLLFASDAAEQRGNQRKTTGSYYTPDSLVQALLDTALDPVLDKTENESEDPVKGLLKLTVIDPACGSGHFLLAAARRIATRVARLRTEGTPSTEDFRHALRDVARRCLHGVDRNPMAVELTKVALWIETVDPGLPLGFFDAQIRCGDALLGVFELKVLEEGIPDAAYKPLTGDDKATAKHYAQANKIAKGGQGELDFGKGSTSQLAAKPLATDFSGFRDLPEDDLGDITKKAARYRELREKPTFTRAFTASDLYIAAFLLPKTGTPPATADQRTIPTSEELWAALNHGKLRESIAQAPQAARQARAFHWPLEFPDVMLQNGGFDVVLGNPPWERIKLQEQEFFAARSPEIAGAQNKAARDRLIKALTQAPPNSPESSLFNAFTSAKREAEALAAFARTSTCENGRFPLCGQGDLNTYGLFAELAKHLANNSGRVGIIVPSEILSSDASKDFFNAVVNEGKLKSAYAFENEEFIFPGIANVNRFALLTLGALEKVNEPIKLAFYLRRAEHLHEQDRFFSLKPSDFSDINPNTLTCPVFRTQYDAELTSKIYRKHSILIDESSPNVSNLWKLDFMRMFDMANDSDLFINDNKLSKTTSFFRGVCTESTSGKVLVPLYEGKFIWHFDHRFSSYHNLGKIKGRGGRGLPPVLPEEYANPDFEITPRYWVDQDHVAKRLSLLPRKRNWLMGWRDVSSAKLERTMVCTVLPCWGVNHKLPLLFTDFEAKLATALLCNFSSIPFDYITRQKMGGTSFAYFYLKQLPVLPPSFYSTARLDFIAPRVLELTYTSNSLTPFARDMGYDGPPFPWNEDRRALLRAELDAFYARAYGLTRDELRYILDPADVKGPDYPSETFRVLKEKELRQYGEYRTRRLVLEAWDRMEGDNTFNSLGLGTKTSTHHQMDHSDSEQRWKLPTVPRAPLLSYQYVVSVMTEMLIQSGNSISWTELCSATDLLKDRANLAEQARPFVGAIADAWLTLNGDRFDATQRFDQLSGLCTTGRMDVIQVDDELVVRLLTRDGHPDFPHVRFDARLALAVSRELELGRTAFPDLTEQSKVASLAHA